MRECVREHGPILQSMVGRLYHEKYERHFAADFPEGMTRFLRERLAKELTIEPQKGQAAQKPRGAGGASL